MIGKSESGMCDACNRMFTAQTRTVGSGGSGESSFNVQEYGLHEIFLITGYYWILFM